MKNSVSENKTPVAQSSRPRCKATEDLQIALSLARGNSPAIKPGPRLDLIAFHVERALRTSNLNTPADPNRDFNLVEACRSVFKSKHAKRHLISKQDGFYIQLNPSPKTS